MPAGLIRNWRLAALLAIVLAVAGCATATVTKSRQKAEIAGMPEAVSIVVLTDSVRKTSRLPSASLANAAIQSEAALAENITIEGSGVKSALEARAPGMFARAGTPAEVHVVPDRALQGTVRRAAVKPDAATLTLQLVGATTYCPNRCLAFDVRVRYLRAGDQVEAWDATLTMPPRNSPGAGYEAQVDAFLDTLIAALKKQSLIKS